MCGGVVVCGCSEGPGSGEGVSLTISCKISLLRLALLRLLWQACKISERLGRLGSLGGAAPAAVTVAPVWQPPPVTGLAAAVAERLPVPAGRPRGARRGSPRQPAPPALSPGHGWAGAGGSGSLAP